MMQGRHPRLALPVKNARARKLPSGSSSRQEVRRGRDVKDPARGCVRACLRADALLLIWIGWIVIWHCWRLVNEAHVGEAAAASPIPISRGSTAFNVRPSEEKKLLLATHNRLLWYFYEREEVEVLHQGQGVYYGFFPGYWDPDGNLKDIFVVSRPHNWHPMSAHERLLHLDASTGVVDMRKGTTSPLTQGKELDTVLLTSKFTHDAVRSSDRVYICDTGSGAVLELSFPGMQQLRRLPLFTRKEHVNTLAPVTEGSMWAVLHNLGQSQLAKIDLSSGMEVGRWNNVGVQSHGLVEWRYWFIMLDSGNGALLLVNPDNGRQMQIWKLPDDGRYLKGLTVADDVAYFGIAPLVDRQSRDDSQMSCELGAFDLIRNTLLWRRQLPTHGLLNVVGAPQWGESSTYKAVTSWARATPGAIRDMSQDLRACQRFFQYDPTNGIVASIGPGTATFRRIRGANGAFLLVQKSRAAQDDVHLEA